MAGYLGRTRISIEDTGSTVNVPDNPRAKLMYYLDCVLSLAADTSPLGDDIRRLRDYKRYYALTDSEVKTLVFTCILLSPDELIGKLIFVEPELCGDSSNEFYKISEVSNNILVSDSIMIGGQRQRVTQIMACKQAWLEENWIQPMTALKPLIERRPPRQSSCVIL